MNLALAVIVFYLMEKILAGITHGDNGLWFLTSMSSTPVLDLTKPSHFFIFSFWVALALWAFYKYLDDSVYGACCLATKINEDKLKFLGYSTFNIRWLAFIIANTTTALAGALYAVYFGFVSPEITSPARAADPVVPPPPPPPPPPPGTILGEGGVLAHSYGPIVGAIVNTGMKDLISRSLSSTGNFSSACCWYSSCWPGKRHLGHAGAHSAESSFPEENLARFARSFFLEYESR